MRILGIYRSTDRPWPIRQAMAHPAGRHGHIGPAALERVDSCQCSALQRSLTVHAEVAEKEEGSA